MFMMYLLRRVHHARTTSGSLRSSSRIRVIGGEHMSVCKGRSSVGARVRLIGVLMMSNTRSGEQFIEDYDGWIGAWGFACLGQYVGLGWR